MPLFAPMKLEAAEKLSIHINSKNFWFVNSVHFIENRKPGRDYLHFSFLLSAMTVDLALTIVNVGCCFGLLEGNSVTIKLSYESRDLQKSNLVGGRYSFYNQ